MFSNVQNIKTFHTNSRSFNSVFNNPSMQAYFLIFLVVCLLDWPSEAKQQYMANRLFSNIRENLKNVRFFGNNFAFLLFVGLLLTIGLGCIVLCDNLFYVFQNELRHNSWCKHNESKCMRSLALFQYIPAILVSTKTHSSSSNPMLKCKESQFVHTNVIWWPFSYISTPSEISQIFLIVTSIL